MQAISLPTRASHTFDTMLDQWKLWHQEPLIHYAGSQLTKRNCSILNNSNEVHINRDRCARHRCSTANNDTVDIANPSLTFKEKLHKKKCLIQTPDSYFMDIKCPGVWHCNHGHASVADFAFKNFQDASKSRPSSHMRKPLSLAKSFYANRLVVRRV